MKVILREDLGNIPKALPGPGCVGEALYFRYDDKDQLKMVVLFYGWPGIHEVYPHHIEPLEIFNA